VSVSIPTIYDALGRVETASARPKVYRGTGRASWGSAIPSPVPNSLVLRSCRGHSQIVSHTSHSLGISRDRYNA
jgi:hypothetical protein